MKGKIKKYVTPEEEILNLVFIELNKHSHTKETSKVCN